MIRSLLIGALVLVPTAIASADGCPRNPGNVPAPAPAPQSAPLGALPLGALPLGATPSGQHGGSVIVLGASQNQFEVVHDTSLGKVTVYSLSSPSGSVSVAQAPVIQLDGGRELTLVAIPGETNAWAITDDSFRGGTLAGRLMVRSSDRWETAALTSPAPAPATAGTTPAPAPAPAIAETPLPRSNDNPAPAVPTAWNEPAAAHGGRILAACGGSFEFVRDPATGKATLYLLSQGGPAKMTLDADPVLTVNSAAGDPRSLAMTAVAGTSGAWEVTVDVFKGDAAADGTVKVSIDGRPCEINLRDTNPPAPAAVPADAPKNDAPKNDAPKGDMPVGDQPPAPAPAAPPAPNADKPAPPEAPGVKTPGGDRSDNPKNEEPKSDASATNVALVFGGGIAKMDLRRDAGLGTVTLTTPSDVRAARLDGAPVLVLETPAGKKELTFEKGADEGTWTVTSDELKSTSSLKAVVRITIEGKALEADAAPQFAEVKRTPSDMR